MSRCCSPHDNLVDALNHLNLKSPRDYTSTRDSHAPAAQNCAAVHIACAVLIFLSFRRHHQSAPDSKRSDHFDAHQGF
jgi:hypothetical protein